MNLHLGLLGPNPWTQPTKAYIQFRLGDIMNHKDNRLILEPYVEVPAREKWLFDNKAALKKVKQGLKDAVEKRVTEKDSFASYVEDDNALQP
jgi:hypothetical protein